MSGSKSAIRHSAQRTPRAESLPSASERVVRHVEDARRDEDARGKHRRIAEPFERANCNQCEVAHRPASRSVVRITNRAAGPAGRIASDRLCPVHAGSQSKTSSSLHPHSRSARIFCETAREKALLFRNTRAKNGQTGALSERPPLIQNGRGKLCDDLIGAMPGQAMTRISLRPELPGTILDSRVGRCLPKRRCSLRRDQGSAGTAIAKEAQQELDQLATGG